MVRPAGRNEDGFTLLEALVSISGFLVVMIAMLQIYSAAVNLRGRAERRLDLQQNVRVALGQFTREIRLAGYFPENFAPTPPVPALDDPIRVATDSAFAFYGDGDGSGASAVFLYCLDGSDLRRARLASGAATICSAGDLVAERVQSLQFRYFDANNAPVPDPPDAPYQLDGENIGGAPSLTDTTERRSVRRVAVIITSQNQGTLSGNQTYTLTSDIWIRNAN
jgi:Tfp pilus assembly protein PilW